jgi:hypothetical protein
MEPEKGGSRFGFYFGLVVCALLVHIFAWGLTHDKDFLRNTPGSPIGRR